MLRGYGPYEAFSRACVQFLEAVFRILPLRTGAASPLDVKGVKVKVSAGDLVAIVREGRERG